MDPPGLYVHIPFCKTKCPYCDFYSVTDLSALDTWLEALNKEADMYRDVFGTFDSLYLGGGTPSLLDNRQMETLIKMIRRCFAFTNDVEISMEVNPDDVDVEKLKCWHDCGINRISIGVQSFDDDELVFLKRRHSATGAKRSIEHVVSVGFENFGIDLMFGLPSQTEDILISNLEKALTFEPKHLSCYQLTLEKKTPYGRLKAEGRIKPLSENKEKRLFALTSAYLKSKGFIHYEISNFAKAVQYESRHNKKYWQHIQYLGLGPAAHSFNDNKRWWNCKSVDRYCKDISKRIKPIDGFEILSDEQLRLERLLLGFRTKFGVAIRDVKDNQSFEQTLLRLQRRRIVKVVNDKIVPTVKGFLIANRLPQMFF